MKMHDALPYFCGLTTTTVSSTTTVASTTTVPNEDPMDPPPDKKQEFIDCPHVSGDAENYFSLAKEVGCSERLPSEEFADWLSGCDPVCQRVKAQAFVNLKDSEEASEFFYAQIESKWAKVQTEALNALNTYKQLSKTMDDYMATQKPETWKKALNEKIDTSTLSEEAKTALKDKIKVADGIKSYKQVKTFLMDEHKIHATEAFNANENKDAAINKQDKIRKMFKKTKMCSHICIHFHTCPYSSKHLHRFQ